MTPKESMSLELTAFKELQSKFNAPLQFDSETVPEVYMHLTHDQLALILILIDEEILKLNALTKPTPKYVQSMGWTEEYY